MLTSVPITDMTFFHVMNDRSGLNTRNTHHTKCTSVNTAIVIQTNPPSLPSSSYPVIALAASVLPKPAL